MDDQAENGGIYEPIRAFICGPGPCEGQNIERYRAARMILKQVEDAIAGQCYEIGRKQMLEIFRKESEMVQSLDDGTMYLKISPTLHKILYHDAEKK